MKFDFTKPAQSFFCGVIVTCFQLTAGVAGPLIDMFFQRIEMTRHQVIATKAFSQTISHVTKFVYFGFILKQTQSAPAPLPLWLYFAVIPVAILGNHIATYVLKKLTDNQFYNATQIMLWSIGAVYIGKALFLL